MPDSFKKSLTEHILIKCANLRKHDEDTPPWQYSELMLHCLEANLDDRRTGYMYHNAFDRIYEDVRNEVVMKTAVGDNLTEQLNALIK